MSDIWKYFECQRCGKCCEEIGLPYDPESAFKIADFLGITIEELIDNYYGEWADDHKVWTSQGHKRTPCPFLKSEGMVKRCEIYDVRPKGCRLYPFDTDGGRAGVKCPGAEMAMKKWDEIHKSEVNDRLCGPFILLKTPFDEKFPGPSIAYIGLGSHSVVELNKEKNICLSSDCYNYQELKSQVELLKNELNEIAEEGKEFFIQQNAKKDEWRNRMKSQNITRELENNIP